MLCSLLSCFEDDKVITVVDKDAAEETRGQDTVESLFDGILLNAGESEEGHGGQLE